jgi:hypothetical protein
MRSRLAANTEQAAGADPLAPSALTVGRYG